MGVFPTDPHKIRSRIRSYERQLQKELAETGMIHDGYGKRYLLGCLYLLMDDTAGALQHYAWFEQTCLDDSGDPLHLLCWTLALYRAGNLEAAARKLRRTMLSNLYLLPYVLGRQPKELDLGRGPDVAEQIYLDYLPEEVLTLLDADTRQWLAETYDSPDLTALRARYLALQQQLAATPRGPRREQLLDEAFALQYAE